MKTKDMCSIAFKDAHTQELKVPAGSSVSVPYTVVPLVVGELPIEVTVAAGDMRGGDRIQKSLHVVVSRLHPVGSDSGGRALTKVCVLRWTACRRVQFGA